jgi:hypothetical protein
MADTDDEQNPALELDHGEQGDDDSPESLSERLRARDRDERPAAVLTPEDARRLEELEELDEEEEVELDAHDKRELDELRIRRETLDATAQTKEALRLADVAEVKRERHRSDSIAERRQGRSDRAHSAHLLDEAAARPDEPGADATAAAGRRYDRAAKDQDRAARYDEGAERWWAEEARDRRSEAAQQPGQPPAGEAVRNPPESAPTARKFEKRRKHVKKKRERHPGELRDIGLGD